MTWITSTEALTHPGSVGKAIWGEVHVCGDDGEELPTGEDGVVYFGAAHQPVTFEYNHDPEKTKQTFNDEGWATLWDVGHLDEEGYLYLTDRKLFMIVSGGVNIYPQEIEDVLVLHPAVADVAVFGVPDPRWGRRSRRWSSPHPAPCPAPSWRRRSSPSAGTTFALQVPALGRLHRRPAPRRERQALQEGPARDLLGQLGASAT